MTWIYQVPFVPFSEGFICFSLSFNLEVNDDTISCRDFISCSLSIIVDVNVFSATGGLYLNYNKYTLYGISVTPIFCDCNVVSGY